MKVCLKCNGTFEDDVEYCPRDQMPLVAIIQEQDQLLNRDIDGRFRIIERIGKGGMGAVYKAVQASVGREIALKVLSRSLATDPVAVSRFLQEASAASKLTHPNTVTLFDFGQTSEGLLYIAMELLPGASLDRLIIDEAALSLDRTVNILVQICNSLSEAHSMGIIHRDLKPDNIRIFEQYGIADFVKVLDFGVAKLIAENRVKNLTETGIVCGTPYYMSPEQIQGEDVDLRTDIYSSGVIFYEMLCGTPPFVGQNTLKILLKHLQKEPLPLKEVKPDLLLPPSVERLINRCLDKDPDKRPQSMEELKSELLALIEAPIQSSISPAAPSESETLPPSRDTVTHKIPKLDSRHDSRSKIKTPEVALDLGTPYKLPRIRPRSDINERANLVRSPAP